MKEALSAAVKKGKAANKGIQAAAPSSQTKKAPTKLKAKGKEKETDDSEAPVEAETNNKAKGWSIIPY